MNEAPDINGLGYLVLGSRRIEAWRDFATRLLGMQPVETESAGAAFRMDDRPFRLLVEPAEEERVAAYGWEAGGAVALDRLARKLGQAGFAVDPLPDDLAERRGIERGFAIADPEGRRLELYHGGRRTAAAFQPGRPISGFRTGGLGMGHAALAVEKAAPMLAFYRDQLGFRLSDWSSRPFHAYFLHANPRHHSLALIETGRSGLHHLMIELLELDDVGQAYDLALLEQGLVATTLGRHSNDHMLSFYLRTPSDFLIEYGWGGRDIDPGSWAAEELVIGPSLWGHERDWLADDLRHEARRLRLAAAAQGIRVRTTRAR